MWSSGGDDNSNRVSSSSSKSSSSSSSHSPFSTPSIMLPNSRRKTMEEVWKDINLTSLHDHSTHTNTTTTSQGGAGGPIFSNPNATRNSFRGMNLQDFLARPFDREVLQPPQPPQPPPTTRTSNSIAGTDTNIFQASAPPTALRLNTATEFQYLDDDDDDNDHHHPLRSNPRLDHHCNDIASSFVASFNSPFDPFAAASSLSPFCKKRVSDSDENTGDRRHKRMIKNRESAARSRARKQAYTNTLELEVAHLMEENERLKKQQKQLLLAAAAQHSKKANLHRTSTAPF